MFKSLLGDALYAEAIKLMPKDTIGEIRLRTDRALAVRGTAIRKISRYIVTKEDITSVVRKATHSSLYACQDELSAGYLKYDKGIRIGVGGEGVAEGGKLLTFKNITSLNIRIPHEVIGSADSLTQIIDSFENILIISPPYGGKTTLIRDIARILSNRIDTLVLDERGELCGGDYTFGQLIDIVTGVPKTMAVEGVIRAMNPEIIVMDELYPERDEKVIADITRAGIKTVASAHAANHIEFFAKAPSMKQYFTYAVNLGYKPRAGSIKSIVRL